ncbi:hypothetical protein [Escherichia coli]|uniref:hypothetical protein n=1 Tax=Escherichia coli TaxID=562 RepID=UPI001F3D55F0|nr:hypothetical protein [Escherichia coli]EHN4693800.1 hypothetical protein [Escherichia coli]
MKKIDYKSIPKPIDSASERKKHKKEAEKLANYISFIRNNAHGDGDKKLLSDARTQAFGILRKQMQYRLHPGYIIEIRPTERQLFLLNSVFDFVNVVGDLIDRSVDKDPDTNSFLLTNKEYLYGKFGINGWQKYVRFLRAFVDAYKNSDMIYTYLPGGDNCTLSADNRIFIPVLGLGLINAANEKDVIIVKQWRKYEGYRYLPCFDILKIQNKFYVKIKYKEDIFFLRKNKDLLQELSGTIDVILGSRFIKELKESRSFSRVEISESELWGISNNPVNHAHQRNPNKKWS